VSRADRPRIGIDLGGTKIEGVLLDERGALLRSLRVATPRNDYAGTIDAVAELVEQLERDVGPRLSVGVGTPGAISPASGLIKNANSVWLNGRPLAHDLERRLERQVRLANDADCFALSEATDGSGAGAAIVFGVILGTGVGGGIVVDGRLVAGPNAVAGEWGHNPMPWPREAEWPGTECYCGKTGCIETLLSGPGLAGDHQRSTGARLPVEEIVRLADAGAADAAATLERYAERLARALAAVINVLDPHVIVLGGGLSNLEQLYEQVPQRWAEHVFSDRVDTKLVPPTHGDTSGVRGAAWLW